MVNKTKYEIREGSWSDALNLLEEKGGMLFPGKDSESPQTIVRGNIVTTFWKKDSYKRGDIIKFALEQGFSHEEAQIMTAGRMARWYLNEKLDLPYQNTFYGKKYQKLASEAWHWHYLHCDPGQYLFCVEVDLKSAYHSALLTGETLLLDDSGKWLDDNDALLKLKIEGESFPKWFRLTLLGTLASNRMSYLARDKSKKGFHLKVIEQKKISYGAGFNAAHRAILRNWRIMKELHEIAGEAAVRLHTDSILLDMTRLSGKAETLLFDKLDEYGLKSTIKKAGKTALKDVNTGFIGKYSIGAKTDVMAYAKEIKSLPERHSHSEIVLGTIAKRATEIKKGICGVYEGEKLVIDPFNVCVRLGQIFGKNPKFFEEKYLEDIKAIAPPRPPSNAREKWAREELIAVDIAAGILEKGGLKKQEGVQLALLG